MHYNPKEAFLDKLYALTREELTEYFKPRNAEEEMEFMEREMEDLAKTLFKIAKHDWFKNL